VGGQPTYDPSGTIVSTFDTAGNYTLSGSLPSNPAAFIYAFKIKRVDFDAYVDSDYIVQQPFIDVDDSNAILENRVYNALSTGILDGGIISINVDPTKFNISSGSGLIIDNTTAGLYPTRTTVTWGNFTAQTTPFLATEDITFIAIDTAGNLVKQSSDFTATQARQYIVIGWVQHIDRTTIDNYLTEPYFAADTSVQLQTFWEGLGAFNIEGNNYTPNDANLYLDRSAGKTFDNGINYSVDKKHPNVYESIQESIIDFQYYYQTSQNVWDNNYGVFNQIDPNHYDTGSGLALCDTNKWTIQLMYFYSPSLGNDLQFGQTQYDTLDLAKAAIGDVVAINPFLSYDTLRTVIIVKQGANDLGDPTQALFIDAGKFGTLTGGGSGSGGGGGGEINTASNVGAGGLGFYDAKVGVDIQFRNLVPSNLLSVSLNTSLHNVNLDLVTSNMTMFQASGNYLTTAAVSNHTHSNLYINTSKEANFFLTANSSLLQTAGAYLTTAQPVGAYITTAMVSNAGSNFINTGGSTTATTAGSDFKITMGSAGLNFGIPKWITTAQPTGAYLTTARASNDGVGLNTALTANGVSWTVNSSGISLNVPAFLTTAQPTGAYLTTAALSQNTSNYAGIGVTTASTVGSDFAITHNTSGLSMGIPKYLTTAQPTGAYLTTARASNDAIGLNTALTANGISWTVNSSGLSMNVPAFITTAMQSASSSNFARTGFTSASTAGSDLVATHDTNGLNVGVPKWLTTAQAPGAYLTTAMVSNAGSNFVGLNSALTANGVSATINSSGISLNIPAFLTTAMQSASSSNFAKTGFTSASTVGSDMVATHDTNGLNVGIPKWLTTAQAPGAYLTTAMVSNAGSNFVGLNSALTANGVSATINSSGISLNVPAFLTTAMQSASSSVFAKTGVTTASTAGSVLVATHDTNGLNLGVPAWITVGGAGGGAAIKGSGVYSQNTGTVEFANSNGITFGLSNNGTLTASYNSTQFVAASNTGNIYYSDGNGITWGSSVSSLSTSISASYNSTQFAGISHSHGNPTLALTNLTGTTASASNGFTISLSANAPGAAAEANWVTLGGNVAGNSTASGSTIQCRWRGWRCCSRRICRKYSYKWYSAIC